MNANTISREYIPEMEVVSKKYLNLIKHDSSLKWYHSICVDGYITPGRDSSVFWNAVKKFLEKHQDIVKSEEILEFGPADGLWSCWLYKFGAKKIHGADFRDFTTYRMIIETFNLPVEYFPGLISTQTPSAIKKNFNCLVSLGVLYHVHDVLTTLIMYHRYLNQGGYLFLETVAVNDEVPALYYSPDGFILPAAANNQFAPTFGFLHHAIEAKLGMKIKDKFFFPMNKHKQLGKMYGRYLILAQKVNPPKVSLYHKVVAQLGFT